MLFKSSSVSVLQAFREVRLARLVYMGIEKDRASRDAARESSLASGWTVEGQPELQPKVRVPQTGELVAGLADPLLDETDTTADDVKQMSSGALVLLGVIGGVYLLFTFVWFSWANAASVANASVASTSGSLGGVLQQIVFWVAPFAPALWFISVLVLCRGKKVWRMSLWLGLGLVVLVPLPMFGGLF
jgi:hypothetical protein